MPYNPYLLAKYDAHINMEICANVKACKYIFKYVHKGSDRASLCIEQENSGVPDGVVPDPVDKIQEYQDARWVGSAEACWRIFAFKLHDHSLAIEWLSIHLLDQHSVLFNNNVDLSDVVHSVGNCQTILTAFFQLNQQEGQAEDLFYTDLPNQYIWKKDVQLGRWGYKPLQRKQGTIARMSYINPKVGELFYLWYLLLNVPSLKLFEDLCTVNRTLLPMFHGACTARGLLHDDAKWDQALGEAGAWQGGACL